MFKGFDKAKDIQYVYTPVFSSLCGVKLDSNNKAGYLLSGRVTKRSSCQDNIYVICLLWCEACVTLRCRQTGSMWSDGRISIGQCDLVESWDNLSLSQKKNLNYRYQMGCECRVSKGCSFLHTYLSSYHSSVSSVQLPPWTLTCATKRRKTQLWLCFFVAIEIHRSTETQSSAAQEEITKNKLNNLLSTDQHVLHSAVCVYRRKRVLVDWLAAG